MGEGYDKTFSTQGTFKEIGVYIHSEKQTKLNILVHKFLFE